MDTLTIDVRGLPSEKIQEIKQKIELWKQEDRLASVSTPLLGKFEAIGLQFYIRDSAFPGVVNQRKSQIPA